MDECEYGSYCIYNEDGSHAAIENPLPPDGIWAHDTQDQEGNGYFACSESKDPPWLADPIVLHSL